MTPLILIPGGAGAAGLQCRAAAQRRLHQAQQQRRCLLVQHHAATPQARAAYSWDHYAAPCPSSRGRREASGEPALTAQSAPGLASRRGESACEYVRTLARIGFSEAAVDHCRRCTHPAPRPGSICSAFPPRAGPVHALSQRNLPAYRADSIIPAHPWLRLAAMTRPSDFRAPVAPTNRFQRPRARERRGLTPACKRTKGVNMLMPSVPLPSAHPVDSALRRCGTTGQRYLKPHSARLDSQVIPFHMRPRSPS